MRGRSLQAEDPLLSRYFTHEEMVRCFCLVLARHDIMLTWHGLVLAWHDLVLAWHDLVLAWHDLT